MSKSNHQWQTYYSPRNGHVSIQACRICGVAKGIATSSYGCKPNVKRSRLLENWSTEAPVEQSAKRERRISSTTQRKSKVLSKKTPRKSAKKTQAAA